MLDATEVRPDGADTVYAVNIDITILQAQLREISQTFADAVDNGNLTISTTDPTKSLLASVEFQSSGLTLTDSEILVLIRELRGILYKPIRFDIDAGRMAASREMYTPSSSLNQTVYTVADLPD